MTKKYMFEKTTKDLTLYTKSSATLSFSASAAANTMKHGLSVQACASAEFTFTGLKVSLNTPTVVSIDLSANVSWDWEGGTKFEYTGIGAEVNTAKSESALAATRSKVSELQDRLANLSNKGVKMGVKGVELDNNLVSVS